MNKCRTTRFIASAAAIAALALAGCGRPGGAEKGTERPDERPKVKLSVFAGQSTPDPGTEEMIDELLEKELPNVELEWESVGWGDKFQSQMQAKLAAGEVPDIIIGKAQDVGTYQPSGDLAPISPDLARYVRREALASVSAGGAVYGLPYNAFYQGVLYSKDIFDRLGIAVPRTRTELGAAVAKLRAAGITPFAAALGENWYVGNVMMQLAMGDVFEAEPDWGDLFRSGEVSFAGSPGMRRCAAALRFLRDSSWPDALSLGAAECDERFAAGKAAMYVTGTWTLQTINAVNPSMRIGLFPYPGPSGPSKLIFEPNMTFMKSSKTAHPAEVDRVLAAIFSSGELASEILGFTRTSSVLESPGPSIDLPVQAEIGFYSKEGRVVDVTEGNTQLIWSFQEGVAVSLTQWLQGKKSLAEAFAEADLNRVLSGPR